MDLDAHIKRTLETRVAKLDAVFRDEDKKRNDIKVASIYYGYKNGDLIRALKARGAVIGAGNFHLIHEKDDLIN